MSNHGPPSHRVYQSKGFISFTCGVRVEVAYAFGMEMSGNEESATEAVVILILSVLYSFIRILSKLNSMQYPKKNKNPFCMMCDPTRRVKQKGISFCFTYTHNPKDCHQSCHH